MSEDILYSQESFGQNYVPIDQGQIQKLDFREVGFVAVLVFLCGIAFFLHRTENTFFGLLIVGGFFVISCIIEPRVGVYAYGFWQSWDTAVAFGGEGAGAWITPAKLLVFLIIGVSLLKIWQNKIQLSSSRPILLWLLAFCLIAGTSIIWSYAKIASIRYTLQMFTQLILMVIMIHLIGKDWEYLKRLFFWTVVGGVTASVYILLFGMEQKAYGRGTLSEQANPAAVALVLMTAICCIPFLWLFIGRGMKILLIASGLLLFGGMFATGTRAAVAGTLIAFLGGTLFSRNVRVHKRIFQLLVMGIVFYVSAYIFLMSGLLSQYSEERLAKMLMLPSSQGTAGREEGRRMDIWKMTLEGYMKTNLVGTGIGATSFGNLATIGVFRDVHCNVLGSLTEMGPLGFLIFSGIHVAIILQIFRLRNRAFVGPIWIILLGSFQMGFVHTSYTSKGFWFPITLILIIYEMDACAIPQKQIPELDVDGNVYYL